MKLQIVGLILFTVTNLINAAPLRFSLAQSAEAAGRRSPVQVGEMAPDFTLEDQQGRKVTLSAARGKMPTVLVFYRGYW